MNAYVVHVGRNREFKVDIAWAATKERAMQLVAENNPGWRPFAIKDVTGEIDAF